MMEKSRQNITMQQSIIRRLKINYILIFLSLILGGCGSETSRTLRHADSVMEAYPDSAMTILSSIDRHTLKDSDLPYFALLYTQAQVKTDVPLDSDSLISIAYAKYGDDTDGDLGIRSNFYTGEVFFNQKKYREAMPYYLTAYEESKRLSNDYWHAKAAERISNIYFSVYNYDVAAKYVQEAAECYKDIQRTRNNRFALGQLANILVNNGDPATAYTLLDSLKTLTLKQNLIDTVFLDYIKIPLIDAMLQTGRIKDTEVDSIEFFVKGMTKLEVLDAAILQSQVYNVIGNPNEAKDHLDEFGDLPYSDEDKIHLLYARYETAKKRGDSTLALSLVDSMLYYQNTVAEDIIQESIKGAQSDFYSEMAVRNESKSLYFRKLLWTSVCGFLLVVAFLIAIFHYRSKAHKVRLEANFESFLSLKEHSDRISREKEVLEQSLNEKNIIVNRLEIVLDEKHKQDLSHAKVVERLFKEKWSTLDALCNQYFGLNNYELNAKDLVSNIEKELKKIVSKKGLAEIVASVDTYMGGIITDLKIQCPFLKETDINFLALLYAGFSVRAVCMFTGIKYPHFYVKKSRLIKRIESSDAPDKSLFLEKLK